MKVAERPSRGTLRVALTLALAACMQTTHVAPPTLEPVSNLDGSTKVGVASLFSPLNEASGRITHVIVIVQENRSTDDLFNGLPGADTVTYGYDKSYHRVPLQPILLTAPYDLDHRHAGFETEFDGGRMNGFGNERSKCLRSYGCPHPSSLRPYGYVPRQEVEPYFIMAMRYTFADRMFQTNEGPSFPAHQYIISGTSTNYQGSPMRAAENAGSAGHGPAGGCDSPKESLVRLIDPAGIEDERVYPYFERPTLSDLVEAKSLTWRYYVNKVRPGAWNAPDAIIHIRRSEEYRNVVAPSARVLDDILHGRLANVVWVTPSAKASDHSGVTDGSGPSWVASIVNTVGQSPYWRNTAILVMWDDWGGWYDHVTPPRYNSYELGFRVPLIVISAYAKNGYVSHSRHEFGSILKFIEETFDLGSLDTTDMRSDNLADCFNFKRPPTRFKRIPAKYPASYFLHQPVSDESPDDDF